MQTGLAASNSRNPQSHQTEQGKPNPFNCNASPAATGGLRCVKAPNQAGCKGAEAEVSACSLALGSLSGAEPHRSSPESPQCWGGGVLLHPLTLRPGMTVSVPRVFTCSQLIASSFACGHGSCPCAAPAAPHTWNSAQAVRGQPIPHTALTAG